MPTNPYEPPKEESRFSFYEKVRIVSCNSAISHLQGRVAAVIGKAEDEDGQWSYALHVYGEEHTYCCSEDELESTGEFDCRETFFTGESVHVSRDGQVLE